MLAILGLALVRASAGQQAGGVTQESHPPITLEHCSESWGCVEEPTAVVLDSQWRWLHQVDGYTRCMDDAAGTWDSAICPDPDTCTRSCGVEGLTLEDYEETYGVAPVEGGVKLKYVPGSRVYVLDGKNRYKMFKLLNREISIDVDVSLLPCGTNAAVYFVEMPADGGPGAGAEYGAGYCDAQCPKAMKFVDGVANSLQWGKVQKKTPWGELKEVGPQGMYGACCAEMDLLEANREASAITAHPCALNGPQACSSPQECGDSEAGEHGVCDKAGCGFNSYRMGDHSFYGSGPDFYVDTSKVMTLITQFITSDGTDDGDLVEIRRVWVQDGKVIKNSKAPLLGLDAGRSLTDDLCKTSATVFNASMDSFTALGGLKAMGDAMGRGMVLTLSVWDDPFSNMLWLDAESESPREDRRKPGVSSGPCAFSPYEKEMRTQYKDASATFTNIRYGEIGSTMRLREAQEPKTQAATSPPLASASSAGGAPTGDQGSCCLAASNAADFCGTCFERGWAGRDSWCSKSYANCHNCTGHAVAWCEEQKPEGVMAFSDSLRGIQMKESMVPGPVVAVDPVAAWTSSAVIATSSAAFCMFGAVALWTRRFWSGYGELLPESAPIAPASAPLAF